MVLLNFVGRANICGICLHNNATKMALNEGRMGGVLFFVYIDMSDLGLYINRSDGQLLWNNL